jgi:NAD(P)-dependent dehydrogenase (short-subunit alcohol dehydrogenase family)
MNTFAEKVALVTGGSSGIGRATAIKFGERGAKVVVAARREKEGNETVEMIKKAGGEAMFVQTDVRIASQVENMVQQTIKNTAVWISPLTTPG